jgi:membrane-associated phospholipid phosphatase
MLFGAALCVAAAALVWAIAFNTARGVRLDVHALNELIDLDRPPVESLAQRVSRLADPLPFALLSAGVLAVALARGGVRLALIVGVVLVGACLTSQVLKQVTAEPRGIDMVQFGRVGPESWPSGHTTAAAVFAFCLLWVGPPRLRPLAAAVGGAIALAVSISVLVLGWHFPSDVLGGFCVAAAWTLCGLAAARATRARRTASSSPSP